jgi:hypothetical protein
VVVALQVIAQTKEPLVVLEQLDKEIMVALDL